MSGLPTIFSRYRSEVEAELRSVLAPYKMPLYDMMRYHLGWSDECGNAAAVNAGKALRPTLCLLACEAVCRDYTRALPAAAAVELVHNFSLIHDDIQDDDGERRSRPTVWKVWGKPQAINAGTAMHILANVAIERAAGAGAPADACRIMQSRLDHAALRLIEGQYLDIQYEQRSGIGVDEYLSMISGKTAALIACSLELGVLAGGGSEVAARSFGEFGEVLGLAFQVRDDMLGIWGDPEKTGKERGNDIRRKKKSLPIVLALARAGGKERETIARIFRQDRVEDEQVDVIFGLMNDMNIRGFAQGMVDDYCGKARRILAAIGTDDSMKEHFGQVLGYLRMAG